jgi:hypothetical protein
MANVAPNKSTQTHVWRELWTTQFMADLGAAVIHWTFFAGNEMFWGKQPNGIQRRRTHLAQSTTSSSVSRRSSEVGTDLRPEVARAGGARGLPGQAARGGRFVPMPRNAGGWGTSATSSSSPVGDLHAEHRDWPTRRGLASWRKSHTVGRQAAEGVGEACRGDVAVAQAPPSRRISLALFMAGFATFSLIYCTQPLLPEFTAEFGVDPATSSLALSLTTGCLALSILCVGALSEMWGRRGLMFA